ncbi:magnesium transporter [Patescibacteria group bacterium]|nr:magnesium transporter [Patescibacteria group bacterium]
MSTTVHDISYNSKNRHTLFLALSPKEQAITINQLSKTVQKLLISQLKNTEISSFLEYLDPDEVTNILRFLPKKRQELLMNQLSEYYQQSVSILLKFDAKTAAGLMNLNYIQVDDEATIFEVIEQLKINEKRTGKLPTILVMNEGKLIGYLSFSSIALANKSKKIKDYVKKIHVIRHSSEYDKVIKLFKQNTYNKIVVLNENDAVVGIIYSEDILRLIGEQSSASLYSFAGVSNEETVFDSAPRKIKFRYKWLIVNLATAFLVSFVVRSFSATIAKNVLLAVYMPIVASMGGNSGTQTLAVMIRSLSNNKLSKSTVLRTLKNEVITGGVNGLINGFIVAVLVMLLNQDIWIALILAIAMIVNLIVSSIFGTIVPVIMKKLGKDPASSAAIFITTATDVFGFLTFLGLATILIK